MGTGNNKNKYIKQMIIKPKKKKAKTPTTARSREGEATVGRK